MRKWYVPLTLAGLGGLAALLMTERGRSALSWIARKAPEAPDKLLAWNEAAQRELDRIQAALNRVSESLEAR